MIGAHASLTSAASAARFGQPGGRAGGVGAVGHGRDVRVEQGVVADHGDAVLARRRSSPFFDSVGSSLESHDLHHELAAADAAVGVDVLGEALDGVDVALEQAGRERRAGVGHHLDGDGVGGDARRRWPRGSRPRTRRSSSPTRGCSDGVALGSLRPHAAASTPNRASRHEQPMSRHGDPPVQCDVCGGPYSCPGLDDRPFTEQGQGGSTTVDPMTDINARPDDARARLHAGCARSSQLHAEAVARGLQHPGPRRRVGRDHAEARRHHRGRAPRRPRRRHRRVARHDRARVGGRRVAGHPGEGVGRRHPRHRRAHLAGRQQLGHQAVHRAPLRARRATSTTTASGATTGGSAVASSPATRTASSTAP